MLEEGNTYKWKGKGKFNSKKHTNRMFIMYSVVPRVHFFLEITSKMSVLSAHVQCRRTYLVTVFDTGIPPVL